MPVSPEEVEGKSQPELPLNERERAFYTAFAVVIGLTIVVMLGLVFGLSHSLALN